MCFFFKELQFSVSRSGYFYYQELKKLVQQYENTTKQLNSSKENQVGVILCLLVVHYILIHKCLQKLIIGLTKAISVPISSITNRSGSDIKSKLSDLNGLLKGTVVVNCYKLWWLSSIKIGC